jgi:hypothetical protein
LRSRFSEKQKNRADKYNLEIVALIEQAMILEDLSSVMQVREELFRIFKEVVEDLDKDRITSESFGSFSFTLETALTTVRDRERILMGLSSGLDNLEGNFDNPKQPVTLITEDES